MLKKILIAVFLIFALGLSFSTARAQTKIINTATTLTQDTIWEDLVTIDGVKVTVAQNVTLTIKPGTIVSGKNGALLYVMGKLNALGDKDKKVRFAPEYNEKPNFCLTYYVDSTSTSEINLANFILEGGGGNQDIASLPALTIRGKASLSQGTIRRNKITGVRVWGSNVKIDDSEIYENESVAVENKSTSNTLNAENNWWGSEEGPTTTAIPNSSRAVVKGAVDYDPWQKKGPIPIVILPGFGGSFSFKLFTDKAKDEWWLPDLGTASYHYFAKALILSNYYHDKDFFWGFYDWRLPCDESAKKYLEAVIDQAKTQSGHFQVHLVAHSMGGLVARSYIQGEDFRDDVDQLATAGTPHLGSSDIYPIWEGAQLLDDKKPFYLYLWYLQALNSDWNQVSFIRNNFPSLGEMLPVYDYLVKNSTGQLVNYTSQKQRNSFLEDLGKPENLDKLKRRVTTTLVAGTGEDTLEKINVSAGVENDSKWEDGIPEPFDPPKDTTQGDGTVTVRSASADNGITKNIVTVANEHSLLLEDSTKPIFEQLKVKAKFPLLFKIMSTFLLTTSGSVKTIIKDGLGNVLGSGNAGEDSVFQEQMVAGKKLAYTEFPLDFSTAQEKEYSITFKGLGNGVFKSAVWNFPDSGEYAKQEIESPVAKGMEINYLVQASDGTIYLSPHISIKNLMVLIDRWYGEQKISSWAARRELINLLAEAYQTNSNGQSQAAQIKLSLAANRLNDYSLEEFPDVSAKSTISQSLQNLYPIQPEQQ
jgi:pimeloyl-ACP methyl ester carboxylesterase